MSNLSKLFSLLISLSFALNVVAMEHPSKKRKLYHDVSSPLMTTTNVDGYNPLHLAMLAKEIDVAQMLLDTPEAATLVRGEFTQQGADGQPIAMFINTVLLAAQLNLPEIGKRILELPGIQNIPSPTGENALHVAIRFGSIEFIQMLLESTCSELFAQADYFGANPLYLAIDLGKTEIAKMILLSNVAHLFIGKTEFQYLGADHSIHYSVKAPFVLAAEKDEAKIGAMILDVACRNSVIYDDLKRNVAAEYHIHQLILAKHSVAFTKMLISHRYASNVFLTSEACAALREALREDKNFEIARAMMNANDHQFFNDSHNNTLLHLAVEFDKEELLDLFLSAQHAHRFTKKNSYGRNALHKAVELGNIKLADKLLMRFPKMADAVPDCPIIDKYLEEREFVLYVGTLSGMFRTNTFAMRDGSFFDLSNGKKELLEGILRNRTDRPTNTEQLSMTLSCFLPPDHDAIRLVNDYFTGYTLQDKVVQRWHDTLRYHKICTFDPAYIAAHKDLQKLIDADVTQTWWPSINPGTRLHAADPAAFLENIRYERIRTIQKAVDDGDFWVEDYF